MAAHVHRESDPDNPHHSPLDDPLAGLSEQQRADLKFDLLVDGELPDEQREKLLRAIDLQNDPDGSWRVLALRFLQRQTEQQAVRRLMTGGNVVPVELVPQFDLHRHILGRIRPLPLMAAAAGLLIAATSALVTFYAVRPPVTARSPAMAEFHTMIPAAVMSSDAAVPISVPMYHAADNAMLLPVSDESDTGMTRRSVIIQSDGGSGFIMIPVSTSKTKVY
jgi:hypothetical protein